MNPSRPSRLPRTAVAVALALLATTSTAAATVRSPTPPSETTLDTAARFGLPRGGAIRLGVSANSPAEQTAFDRRVGHRHSIRSLFMTMRSRPATWTSTLSSTIRREAAAGRLLVFHLGVDGRRPDAAGNRRPIVTLGQLRRGYADRWLVAMARELNATGVPYWIRPMAEMNGAFKPYSAFDRDGKARRDNTTRDYIDAYRRIWVIFRGGSIGSVNRKLTKLHMPPLRPVGDEPIAEGTRVAFVWNPQGKSTPDIRANHMMAYFPGGTYVDIVANDVYSHGTSFYWQGVPDLYNRFPTKPFVIGEWGVSTADAPAIVRTLFAWALHHRRVVALIYYPGRKGTPYDVTSKPRVIAAYRSLARSRAFARGDATPVVVE